MGKKSKRRSRNKQPSRHHHATTTMMRSEPTPPDDTRSWEINEEMPLMIWTTPIPDSLSTFPDFAMEVVENIALAQTARMCRKGWGWDFPHGVYVDPRMEDAEYTIDKEEEVFKLMDVLQQIETKIPAKYRPSSLIAFHDAVTRAYKEFEEPQDGTPWDDIGIAHKCLDRQWFADYSHPSSFGLTGEYVRVWRDTLKELDEDKEVQFSSTSFLPTTDVIETLLGIEPLLEDDELVQTSIGKILVETKERMDQEADKKRNLLMAEYKAQRKAVRHAARQKNLIPGIEVCSVCCKAFKDEAIRRGQLKCQTPTH